ncbi:MAG: hypothetical protein COA79_17200 [Planctomycetota bacterium]|nr:MAG: hypothetical protein COA79_17200 [Planctomycetota bacterium]
MIINNPNLKESAMRPRHPFNDILTTKFKVRVIKKFLDGVQKDKVLDAGCGSGFMLSQIDSLFQNCFGIDMSPEAIEFGAQFTNANLQLGNAEKLAFKDNEFDCIVSTDAFEHIPDDHAAAREAYRVLKENGRLIIYTPTENGLLSKTPMAEYFHDSETSYLLDQRYYTKDSLKELALKAGFKIKYIGYHSVFIQEFFTQMLKLIGRLMGKKYEHQADITNFTKSKLFPFYKYVCLPIFSVFIRVEDFIAENIFSGKLRGHRLVMVCEK